MRVYRFCNVGSGVAGPDSGRLGAHRPRRGINVKGELPVAPSAIGQPGRGP